MKRKEFLEQLGLGAAFVLTATCMGGCKDDDDGLDSEEFPALTALDPVDFTLDLTDPANAALATNGGYVVVTDSKTVVARTTSGDLVAATQRCSHQNNLNVIFDNNEWFCTVHGAVFALDGEGVNEFGQRDLTIYNVEVNGDTVRVFS